MSSEDEPRRIRLRASYMWAKGLLMRFGFAPIRGSNPRASANDQPLCCDGRAPAVVSVIPPAGEQLPS